MLPMGRVALAFKTVILVVPVRLPKVADKVVVPAASACKSMGSPGFWGRRISAMELLSNDHAGLLMSAPFSSSNCIVRV
jgi:hypothetical protein